MSEPITSILIALLLGLLGVGALQLLYRVVEKRLNASSLPAERLKRLKTLWQVGRSLTQALIVLIVLLMILTEAGVNIAPLLASAGVVGLALSLGAQTIIKDFLGGIFILIENQFAVGDTLTLGAISGTVERITLRATYLRDLEGRLHLVPNGDIRTVTNQTSQWAQAAVSLNVDYEADMDQVMQALEVAVSALQSDPQVAGELLEAPKILGWASFNEWAVQVQILAKTRPGQQWAVGRALRKAMLESFQRAGLQVAVPRRRLESLEPEGGK